MIAGSPASARAMATRCFCPPLKSAGKAPYFVPSPTCSSNSLARFFAAAAETPLRSSINSTFSPAVKVGNRQKRTEPLFRQGFEGCHRLGHETLHVENNED